MEYTFLTKGNPKAIWPICWNNVKIGVMRDICAQVGLRWLRIRASFGIQRRLSVFKGFNFCSSRHCNITEETVMKLKAI